MTFNESDHRRDGAGKFSKKDRSAAAGALDLTGIHGRDQMMAELKDARSKLWKLESQLSGHLHELDTRLVSQRLKQSNPKIATIDVETADDESRLVVRGFIARDTEGTTIQLESRDELSIDSELASALNYQEVEDLHCWSESVEEWDGGLWLHLDVDKYADPDATTAVLEQGEMFGPRL